MDEVAFGREQKETPVGISDEGETRSICLAKQLCILLLLFPEIFPKQAGLDFMLIFR
jgi:hypothetical protein